MSSARDEILDRIRRANANAGVSAPATSSESARASAGARATSLTGAESTDVLAMFVERTEDYKAVVEQCVSTDVPARMASALEGARGVLVPDGLEHAWSANIPPENVVADPGTPDGLDRVEGVVTSSAAAIAETGTIVLDHTAGQGRRALTLVPDLHVCLVRASQVHTDVTAAVAALRGSVEDGHPLTWISGPSATSDIELDRVEGVHGPRRLHVIVITDA